MADKNIPEVEHSEETLDQVQGFWNKNKKAIIGVSAAIIIIAGGYLAYKSFVVEPKEEKAAEAIFKAEEYFRNDSLNLALNGDGVNKGFLYVINNYGGTEAGNLAQFYSGIIYLKQGNFANAVKHLENFKTESKQIQMLAYGHLGDSFSEMEKYDDAVKMYKKAGIYFPEDEFNSSEFLFRAGYLLEKTGKTKDAVEVYKQLKEKYPRTEKGYGADKYIYRLSIEPNEFSVK